MYFNESKKHRFTQEPYVHGNHNPLDHIFSFMNIGMMNQQNDLTVESAINEIDGYISYLEDLPAEKVAPYMERLEHIEEHMKKMKRSLNE